MTLEQLQALLLSLLRGKYSSLTISFNDDHAPNYMTAAQWEKEGPVDLPYDWISDEERAKGAAENSVWVAHWYPETPVGFHAIAASSLTALVKALAERDWS